MNDLLGLDINDEDIDTMGGWILTENYEAKQGDILTYGPYNFRIKEMEEHHIRYIEIFKQVKVVSEVKEFPIISQTEIVS